VRIGSGRNYVAPAIALRPEDDAPVFDLTNIPQLGKGLNCGRKRGVARCLAGREWHPEGASSEFGTGTPGHPVLSSLRVVLVRREKGAIA